MIYPEKIKNSFAKIKEDILDLSQEMVLIRQELKKINQILSSFASATEGRPSTHNSTHNSLNYSLKQPYFHSSIGNDGVSTDRQQTDNRHFDTLKRTSEQDIEPKNTSEHQPQLPELSSILANIKQNFKEKFKKLTKQEFIVFSILYTLEEEKKNVGYKDIALRTNLTESSVRDYISRLIHKGIPISKEKINNKIIILKIPHEFKDIATLSSITKLKNL